MKWVLWVGVLVLFLVDHNVDASGNKKNDEDIFRYDVEQVEFMEAFPGEQQTKRTEVLRIDHYTGDTQVLKMKRQNGRWVYYWVEVNAQRETGAARRSSNVPMQF